MPLGNSGGWELAPADDPSAAELATTQPGEPCPEAQQTSWDASGVSWFSSGVAENSLPLPLGNSSEWELESAGDTSASEVLTTEPDEPRPEAVQHHQQHPRGGQKKQHRSSANKAAKQRRQDEYCARTWY